jgi:non-homologous end joining protein Ku
MTSPRSMWSGAIEIGMLNIPITIGKAFEQVKEKSLTTVCYHGDAEGASTISRSERCEKCGGSPQNKRLAIETEDGYRLFDEAEVSHIEVSTKTPTLVIKDVQPLKTLPMLFSTGVYYVRHDEKSKVPPRALNRLIMALGKTEYALVCQWGNSSSQKLCVISAERGVLILRQIPYLNEIRIASKKERLHFAVPSDEAETDKMVELLGALRNPEGFKYESYKDHGLELRQAAVERILEGLPEDIPESESENDEPVDIMAALEMAIANAKG